MFYRTDLVIQLNAGMFPEISQTSAEIIRETTENCTKPAESWRSVR